MRRRARKILFPAHGQGFVCQVMCADHTRARYLYKECVTFTSDRLRPKHMEAITKGLGLFQTTNNICIILCPKSSHAHRDTDAYTFGTISSPRPSTSEIDCAVA